MIFVEVSIFFANARRVRGACAPFLKNIRLFGNGLKFGFSQNPARARKKTRGWLRVIPASL
jgi:hypothetical protein